MRIKRSMAEGPQAWPKVAKSGQGWLRVARSTQAWPRGIFIVVLFDLGEGGLGLLGRVKVQIQHNSI